MKFRTLLLLLLVFAGVTTKAEYSILEDKASTKRIDTTKGEKWSFSCKTSVPAKAEILIYNKEMDIVKNIKEKSFKKIHNFIWKGDDNKGKMLPSQLYTYRLQTVDKDGVVYAIDQTLREGALDTLAYWPKWDKDKKVIKFDLYADALVRVRVGLKNGGLVCTVCDWVPARKGIVDMPWNGWDNSKTKNYSDSKNLKIDLAAISLPPNHILVKSTQVMPASFIDARWIRNAVVYNEKLNPKKIRHALNIVKIPKSERFAISLSTKNKLDKSGFVIPNKKKIKLIIKVPELAKKEMKGQFYETVYFVDGAFVGEEMITSGTLEHTLDTSRFERGKHIYMVNVILGSSRVGSASIKINVK